MTAASATESLPFDRVIVIFNPHSTGKAPQMAQQLCTELTRRLPHTPVQLCPTERAGHGRELARQAAGVGRPLVVSVSGDGGYNEVVDGVMQADNPDVVCAVMAAGNANAHRQATRERPLADAVGAGDVRRIDLLRLTIGAGVGARTQYAHSYIGMGLTPIVAIDLERAAKARYGRSCRSCGPSLGSGRSPSNSTTIDSTGSTAFCSPTSRRWRSTRHSAITINPTTAASQPTAHPVRLRHGDTDAPAARRRAAHPRRRRRHVGACRDRASSTGDHRVKTPRRFSYRHTL